MLIQKKFKFEMFQFIAFSTKRGRSQPGNLEWRLGKLSCAGLTMSNYCAEARGPSSKNLRYFCSRKEGRLEGKCVSYYSVTFQEEFIKKWAVSRHNDDHQIHGREQGRSRVQRWAIKPIKLAIKLGLVVTYTFQWLMECRAKIRLVSTQKVQSKLTWKQRMTICYYSMVCWVGTTVENIYIGFQSWIIAM